MIIGERNSYVNELRRLFLRVSEEEIWVETKPVGKEAKGRSLSLFCAVFNGAYRVVVKPNSKAKFFLRQVLALAGKSNSIAEHIKYSLYCTARKSSFSP